MNNHHLEPITRKNRMRTVLTLFFLSLTVFSGFATESKINLSGIWTVKLDSNDIGISKKWFSTSFQEKISLPGTTDDAKMGNPNILLPELRRPQVSHLTRKNSYVGVAWYSKEINVPANWKNKQITLKLERVIWQTRVWVDGKAVAGKQESLTTPHYIDLTNQLPAGKHRITIRVDNRKKYDITVNDMAHAYTNETQIMWNGIIGEISCTAEDKIHINQIQIYPDIEKKLAKIKVCISNSTGAPAEGVLRIFATSLKTTEKLETHSLPIHIDPSNSTIEISYPMGQHPLLWDEFNPNLYTLSAEIKGNGFQSSGTETFGMRSLTNKNTAIQVNGHPVFLRGTLECCIFPLRGYPPMDKKGWQKVFGTAREMGLNHLRFHSWCPPKYAFEVADEMGFYLQIELPLWSLTVNKDQATDDFLSDEADRIIKEYGNHPSFCFWSIGNELQPDFHFLNAFVDRLKAKDFRHLYTNSSYSFEKGHGDWPERNDDYFITQRTKKGWVRGQGVFDSESPSFNKDYSASLDSMPVPTLIHEVGQYAVYPAINEIEKYTGVLDPLNFKAVKADLIKKGLIGRANDYLMASGKLAAILYKEEIERAMKTNGISGFQLLDLHDFPGQGTALVGLLDAFWDSKGLITAADFRQYCSPVVPLIRYEKATFTNDETFKADVEIINYGNTNLTGKKLSWQLVDKTGALIGTGSLNLSDVSIGKRVVVGAITKDLSGISEATCLKVNVEIEGTPYRNYWQVWVYPAKTSVMPGDIVITSNRDEAMTALSAGKKVLFSPKTEEINGLEGKFVQVFWSPVHFPDQPGTMGLLMNPAHAAFNYFPTEMHTNWQWWDLCKKSKTICIDSIAGATPIVENVDNFMKNRRLCSVFEAKAGNGQLIFSSMDLLTDTNHRPVARQLLYSLVEYMKTAKFKPENSIKESELLKLLFVKK
ncbi:MAG: glycoside hydrolase family 2 TIM barrel-domain containing protein [Bacteroidota bacterium]|nr:glycoside hydrolase family 2 TIM barrel-domain containing protein [Bacteroidota bacterium]